MVWIIEFTKEIEVEANDKKEALRKAIEKLIDELDEYLADDICPVEDIDKIFEIETRNMNAHKAVR